MSGLKSRDTSPNAQDLFVGRLLKQLLAPELFSEGLALEYANMLDRTLPAKAKYGKFDSDRAKKYHGMEDISVPTFFPPVTLLVGPIELRHQSNFLITQFPASKSYLLRQRKFYFRDFREDLAFSILQHVD